MFYLKLFVGFLGIYQKVFKPLTGMEAIFVILLGSCVAEPIKLYPSFATPPSKSLRRYFSRQFQFSWRYSTKFLMKNVGMSYLKTSSLVQSFLQLPSPMVLKSLTFKSTVNST